MVGPCCLSILYLVSERFLMYIHPQDRNYADIKTFQRISNDMGKLLTMLTEEKKDIEKEKY